MENPSENPIQELTEELAPEPPKHPLQKLMDNTWLLLVLGIVVPAISYTAWGWIELLTMTAAQLP